MIPQQDQTVHEKDRQTLASYPEGTNVRIARVLDEKDLLDYLMDLGVKIHEEYKITNIVLMKDQLLYKMNKKRFQLVTKQRQQFLLIHCSWSLTCY